MVKALDKGHITKAVMLTTEVLIFDEEL